MSFYIFHIRQNSLLLPAADLIKLAAWQEGRKELITHTAFGFDIFGTKFIGQIRGEGYSFQPFIKEIIDKPDLTIWQETFDIVSQEGLNEFAFKKAYDFKYGVFDATKSYFDKPWVEKLVSNVQDDKIKYCTEVGILAGKSAEILPFKPMIANEIEPTEFRDMNLSKKAPELIYDRD